MWLRSQERGKIEAARNPLPAQRASFPYSQKIECLIDKADSVPYSKKIVNALLEH